jgi:hypothetical protein
MKILKFTLIALFGFILLFIVAAFIFPRVYKEEIFAVIKEESNRNLRATVDFKDVDVSLFRQFPLLSVNLTELSITGQEDFEGYPLFKSKETLVALSIWDLIKKNAPLRIRKIHMVEPDIRILVLEDGQANYDITIPDSLAEDDLDTTSAIQGAIEAYSLKDGALRYEDRTMPVLFSMAGLDHEGSGDFTSTRFELDTRTKVDTLNMIYDGTAYFTNARATMDAILDIDMDAMSFAFKENALTINALTIKMDGSIKMPGEDIVLDLRVSSPSNKVSDLWSIIPGAYTADYANLESAGTFSLDAWAKGIYNETAMPAFNINSTIKDGRIKYPSLTHAIDNINLDLTLDQPKQSLDDLEIDLPSFRFQIDNQPVSGFLNLKDPMTDPDVKAGLKGTLDLLMLSQAFPIEAATIGGRIIADIQLAARMSALDQGLYDQVNLAGAASLENIRYQAVGQPLIQIRSGEIQFTPQYVDAKNLAIQAGKSDLNVQARIDNILAIIHPERTLKGKFDVRSNLLDLDEWSEPNNETVTTVPQDDSLAIGMPTEQFDLNLNAQIGKLVSSGMTINDLKIIGNAGPRSLKATQLSGKLGRSDFNINGQLENLFGWMAGTDILRGVMNLNSRLLDLNELMPASESGQSNSDEPYAPIAIPADIEVRTNASIAQLIYTNLDLRNVRSKVALGNQIALLEEFEADGLGGKLNMSGSYNAQDLMKPGFHFKYDLQQLDFKQVFEKFNTMRKLAPIGSYLQGRFSTSMVMDGFLSSDMSPIPSSLDAAGFLETFNSILKGFKPLEGLAEKLNIAELKSMDLKNSKNWFEIKQGVVELKEFDHNYKDIALKIGGKHSLDMDMDYQVKAKIPRKYLDKTGITASANTGIKWIENEAAKKGLNVGLGEFINLAVGMTGTMSNPKYSLRVLGSEGETGTTIGDQLKDQATNIGQQAKDSLERLAKQKVEEIKDKAQKEVEKRIDTLRGQAEAKLDSALAKAKEEAAKKVGDEAAKKLEELGGDKAKQEADKIKEKLKKWNPLGKKE